MSKITPFLWFDNNLGEAITFYTSIFKDSKINGQAVLKDFTDNPVRNIQTAEFELAGQRFMGLNGGPMFKFTEAISLYVSCDDQAEIDYYWNALTADGGEESRCGWLKDKFGLSWQIIPASLGKFLSNSDPEKAKKAMQAMFKMSKMDIAGFEEAIK
jgi:predicted 3-demethylubiquinone-9 3-methyltransferase (glyoxalase superfamily)